MTIETKRSFPSRALFAVALAVAFTCLNGAAAAAGLKVEKNILLDTPGGVTISGDVYVPQGKGPFPGVVFFHGGGFVGGSKDDAAIVSYVGKVAEKGYVVFNADYRLLLENGLFPNNVKDAKCALSWFRSNAARYGVDPKRIGAMGESAGAYLAAMLAVTQNMKDFQPDCAVAAGGDTSVTAAMLYYPPTNFESFKGGFAQVLEIELRRMAKLKKKSEVKEYKLKNSPITYVNQAPPLFISYSDPDSIVPIQQQTEMIAALKSAGKVFESYEVTGEGMDHGFILSKPDSPQSVEANRRMFAFMDKYLKGK